MRSVVRGSMMPTTEPSPDGRGGCHTPSVGSRPDTDGSHDDPSAASAAHPMSHPDPMSDAAHLATRPADSDD